MDDTEGITASGNGSGEISRNRMRKEFCLLWTRNIRNALSDPIAIHAVDFNKDIIPGEDANIAPKRGISLISANEVEEAKKVVEAEERKKEEEGGNGFSTASTNEDGPDSRKSDQESFEKESANKASTSDYDHGHPHAKSPNWHGFYKPLKKKAAKPGLHFNTIPAINVPKLTRKKSKKSMEVTPPGILGTCAECCYLKSSWRNFTLAELQAATNNFSHENLIGEGG